MMFQWGLCLIIVGFYKDCAVFVQVLCGVIVRFVWCACGVGVELVQVLFGVRVRCMCGVHLVCVEFGDLNGLNVCLVFIVGLFDVCVMFVRMMCECEIVKVCVFEWV